MLVLRARMHSDAVIVTCQDALRCILVLRAMMHFDVYYIIIYILTIRRTVDKKKHRGKEKKFMIVCDFFLS